MQARNAALVLIASLAGCTEAIEPAAGLTTLQTVWCYRTLADIDCHSVADPAWAGRLVGSYAILAPVPTAAMPSYADEPDASGH